MVCLTLILTSPNAVADRADIVKIANKIAFLIFALRISYGFRPTVIAVIRNAESKRKRYQEADVIIHLSFVIDQRDQDLRCLTRLKSSHFAPK